MTDVLNKPEDEENQEKPSLETLLLDFAQLHGEYSESELMVERWTEKRNEQSQQLQHRRELITELVEGPYPKVYSVADKTVVVYEDECERTIVDVGDPISFVESPHQGEERRK